MSMILPASTSCFVTARSSPEGLGSTDVDGLRLRRVRLAHEPDPCWLELRAPSPRPAEVFAVPATALQAVQGAHVQRAAPCNRGLPSEPPVAKNDQEDGRQHIDLAAGAGRRTSCCTTTPTTARARRPAPRSAVAQTTAAVVCRSCRSCRSWRRSCGGEKSGGEGATNQGTAGRATG